MRQCRKSLSRADACFQAGSGHNQTDLTSCRVRLKAGTGSTGVCASNFGSGEAEAIRASSCGSKPIAVSAHHRK
jgi:hypothetical protein